MSEFIRRIKRVLLYSGLSKEEYMQIQNLYYKANNNPIRMMPLCFCIITLFFALYSFIDPIYEGQRKIFFLVSAFALVLTIFAFNYKNMNKVLVHALIMLFSLSFYVLGIYLGVVGDPDHVAVTYMIAIVILPILFTLRPIMMLTEMWLSVLVFAFLVINNKNKILASIDVADAVIFAVVSSIISIAQNKTRAQACLSEKKLLEKQEEIARSNAILEAISGDYHTVWLVNGFNNEMVFVRSSFKDMVQKKLGLDSGKANYKRTLELYLASFVVEEDRNLVKEAANTDTVLKEVDKQKLHIVSYRRLDELKRVSFHQMVFAKVENYGFTVAFRNVDAIIQEEQKKQRLLEDALSSVEAANKAKTTFLRNMSHDIRTPMNAIMGFTTLATKNVENKELLNDYLNKIKVSSDHLLALINDVLDMSRIESGRVEIDEKPNSLKAIIEDLTNVFSSALHQKKLDFKVQYIDVVDDKIICDKLRINQILQNCMSNAVKFTPTGKTITLKVIQRPSTLTGYANLDFVIQDTGLGMSKEFAMHIFEPFARERTNAVNGIQGTGLGMSITKNIVDMMGGSIEVSSELGVGTEITVSLSLKLNDTKSSAKNIESDFSIESEIICDKSLLSGKRILLVEDNDLNREIVIAMLEGSSVIIDEAKNGKVALEKFNQSSENYYDLILMDIQMPIMDGYSATRAIRALNRSDALIVPIIALSANAFAKDRQMSIDSGMNDHIAKPFNPVRLNEILKKYIKLED